MNKKFSVILFSSLLCFSSFSSENLLDVNYDKPSNTQKYEEDSLVLQEIYLQYENYIRELEQKVRNEERDLKNQEIKSLEVKAALEKESAVEEARNSFYEKEISVVHRNETEKLKQELTIQLKKEFSAEYEEKLKNEKNLLEEQKKWKSKF